MVIIIFEEITGSSQMIGYRMMHLKCIQKGFTVKRETVRLLLSVLDLDGVAYRRAPQSWYKLYVARSLVCVFVPVYRHPKTNGNAMLLD